MTLHRTDLSDEPPCSTDMLLETRHLTNMEMPKGNHWRVMTGNMTHSLWARVIYRYELEMEEEANAQIHS